MRKIILSFEGLNSKEEIQEYIAKRMEFPPYYGKNLDAFYDCLTDICEPTAIACNIPSTWEEDGGGQEVDLENREDYLSRVYKTLKDAQMDNENLAVFWGREIS